MKVKLADGGACPVPRFTIFAETPEEELMLRAFIAFPEYALDEWRLSKPSYTCSGGAYRSFSFGWLREEKGDVAKAKTTTTL